MITDFTPADRELLNELKGKYSDVPPDVAKQKALHELLAIKRKAKERKIAWTAAELLTTEFPPIQWVIPDLVSPGLTVLAGAPKLGKSWMALSWALSVSSGGYALGKMPVQKMGVLYLALEDTPRRLKSRLQKLNATNRDNLHFITEWNKKPSELSAYLVQYPEIRFVVIDTWGRFARVNDYNDYGENTGKAAELKKIADDLDIAVVVIHHARKGGKNDTGDFQDSILGSTGLAGAADSTILLRRGRGNRQAELLATGRDITEQELVLEFDDNCGWTALGDKSEIQESNTIQMIYDWLKKNGANSPKAIYDGLKSEGYEGSSSTIRTLLGRMVNAGAIGYSSGVYLVTPKKPVDSVDTVDKISSQGNELPTLSTVSTLNSVDTTEPDEELEIY